MRKTILTTLSLALVAAPVALAHNGGDKNRGVKDPAAPAPAAAPTTPAAPVTMPACVRAPQGTGERSEFALRGVIATVNGASFTVQTTRVNANMRKALEGPTATSGGSYNAMIPVTIADCTRIKNKRGHGFKSSHHRSRDRNPLSGLVVGARVRVEWKAPQGTLFAALGSPRKVEIKR